MNLKDEAESVEKLAKDMEDRIRRAEEESKERKEALERKIRGATLAEQERQQLNAAGLGRTVGGVGGTNTGAATASPSIAPWLASRSLSNSSISPSGTISRSKSIDRTHSDLQRLSRSKSRGEKAERNLKQVVIVNENEFSDEELENDDEFGGNGLARHNLNKVLKDAVLFNPNNDEENVFSNHHFSQEFSNSADPEHKPGSAFKGPSSLRKQRQSSRDQDEALEDGDTKPTFVKFASPPPKTRPSPAPGAFGGKDRRSYPTQSNREAKLAYADEETRDGGRGCSIM